MSRAQTKGNGMNIGVVGCGYWGPSLIRNLVETNRCKTLVCYDLDREKSQKVARRFQSVVAAASLEELIKRCDAIMVATPVSSHYAVAQAALLQGKSVFVEKPMTNSSAEATDLVATADRMGQVLMVGHTFVYSPPVRKIKRYMETGQLGKIYFISSSRVNLGIHRKDVNVVWDLAPHDVSMLLYWLGEMPSRVATIGRACVGRLVDVASISCEFPSGIIANMEVSWLAPSKLRRTVVVGSRRMVVYDETVPNEKIRLYNSGVKMRNPNSYGEYQLTYRTGEMISPNLESTEPLFTQIQHFLDCVETGKKPLTDGVQGSAVVKVVEAACRSMENNGAYVELSAPGSNGHRRNLALAASAGGR
jgi:predicted dehydrogenase